MTDRERRIIALDAQIPKDLDPTRVLIYPYGLTEAELTAWVHNATRCTCGAADCQEQLDRKAHAYPEMVPLLVMRVEGGGHE